MATLSGNKIKNTYQSLVKFSDNGNITVGAKQLTDGFGNNSPIFVSTTQVGIGVTPESGLNLHVYGDAKIGSNLTVIGNLVVEGSTTTVGTDTLTVKDPLIVLANNNTSTDAVDIGFYGKYTPSGTTLYSGLFREALTGKYRLFKDLQTEPTTTVNTSGTGYAQATLIAALEGNVTGNLTGNVTGGTISGTTGTFSGDVNVNSNLIVTTGTPISGAANGSNVIAKIDSSAGTDSGGLEIHTGDNNGDEPALLHTNYNGDEAFRISSLGHIISTGNGTFTGSLSASFFKGDVYANDGTSKILENGTDGTDATFTGDVTGDVTGDLTGDVTGNVTGNLTGNVTGDITGNVTATSVLADGVTATTQSSGDNSTKVATTAYVDSLQISSTLSEILANGNTSGANDIIMADLQSIYFGTDSDFQLSHNNVGNSFVIHNGTGTLFIRNNTSEQVIKLQAKNSSDVVNDYIIIDGGTERTEFKKDVEIGAGNELYFGDDLQIYHQNHSYIQNFTKDLIIEQNADDKDIVFKSDDGSGGVTEYFRVDGGDERVIYGRSIQMSDNVPVYFGNTIANDGYIKWDSTANELFVNGPVKVLETLGVVGNATFDENVGIGIDDPQRILHTSGDLVRFDNAGTSAILLLDTTNNEGYRIVTNKDNGAFSIEDMGTATGGSGTERLRIDSSGNVGINEDDPDKKLHIVDTSAGSVTYPLRLQNSGTTVGTGVGLIFTTKTSGGGSASCVIRSESEDTSGNSSLVFTTPSGGSTAERMRIDSSGNVTIKAPTASGGGVLNLENTTNAVNGTDWGSLNFISNDTSTSASGIRASVVGTSTSFNGDGNLVFSTAPSNGTNTERMRIDSSGVVSVATGNLRLDGTAKLYTNNDDLTISSDDNGNGSSGRIMFRTVNQERMRIDSSGNLTVNNGNVQLVDSNKRITVDGSDIRIWQRSNANIQFLTNDLQRMLIDGSGQVGINDTVSGNFTTNYGTKLLVGGEIIARSLTASASMISIGGDSTSAFIKVGKQDGSQTARPFRIEVGTSERMRLETDGDLHVDGDVVAYSTTISDKRLKDDVKPIESSLDKVINLKGVEYVWNDGSRKGQKDIGFIAQEVEEIIPEIVREKEVIFNKEEKYKTVDYEKITAVLVEAVKELKAEVEELKKQIR